MAETIQSLRVEVRITGTVIGTDGAKLVVSEVYDKTFGDGTGTDQAGAVWQDQTRALNTTSEELNLDALADFQGATMSTLSNLSVMYFRNLDTTAGDNFLLGGSAANAFVNWVGNSSDKINIGPDGIFLLISPVDKYAITAATGDLLKVEAIDNSTYRLIIAGDNS